MSDRKRVLFLCYGRSAESLMAEEILREYAGDEIDAVSASINPYPVPREVVEVMKEMDIDISGRRQQWAERLRGEEFDYVITIDRYSASAYLGFIERATWIAWDFDELPEFRGGDSNRIAHYRWRRIDIAARLLKWLREMYGWGDAPRQ